MLLALYKQEIEDTFFGNHFGGQTYGLENVSFLRKSNGQHNKISCLQLLYTKTIKE